MKVTRGKHFNNCFILLRHGFWAFETTLTLPLCLIEVPVSSLERARTCIYAQGITILPFPMVL